MVRDLSSFIIYFFLCVLIGVCGVYMRQNMRLSDDHKTGRRHWKLHFAATTKVVVDKQIDFHQSILFENLVYVSVLYKKSFFFTIPLSQRGKVVVSHEQRP